MCVVNSSTDCCGLNVAVSAVLRLAGSSCLDTDTRRKTTSANTHTGRRSSNKVNLIVLLRRMKFLLTSAETWRANKDIKYKGRKASGNMRGGEAQKECLVISSV